MRRNELLIQQEWISETGCHMKEALHKSYVLWFHLHQVLEKCKLINSNRKPSFSFAEGETIDVNYEKKEGYSLMISLENWCSCTMRKPNQNSISNRSRNSRSANWWRQLKNWIMIPFPSSFHCSGFAGRINLPSCPLVMVHAYWFSHPCDAQLLKHGLHGKKLSFHGAPVHWRFVSV